MLPFRRVVGIIVGLVFAGVLGAGVVLRLRAASASEDESATAILEGAAPSTAEAFTSEIYIPVSGAVAKRDTFVLSVNASGQAQAWRRTVITPLVAGRIVTLPARENGVVAAGGALAQLDPVEYELRVREAEVALRNAQAAYRELTLFDDQITDPETRAERDRFARARSGLEAAELALQRAELELSRAAVTAPIAGRVADVRVVPGQWVEPSTELMTIVDIDPIRVQVQVLEGEIGYLRAGREARVSFAAFPDEPFVGEIETINPVVDEATRTARVTVLIPNADGRILPGMFARVALAGREYPDRVMVPRAAILERDRRTMLFVYEGDEAGGRAKWRYVTTGLENEDYVEIVPNAETDSVRAGEIVLTDGHYTLIHDAQVRLVEPAGGEAGR